MPLCILITSIKTSYLLLELFQYLKPEAAFYVPHDLTSCIEDTELCWLPFFTASLNPLPNLWWLNKFSSRLRGRLNSQNLTKGPDYMLESSYGNRHKFIYFPTFAETHKKLGVDGIYKLYRPMFEREVPIKLFNWEGT